MKSIPLTQGKIAMVSDHRYLYLSQWTWAAQHIGKKWYAIRSIGPKKNRKRIYMHRLILDAPAGMQVDHKDGDGLNNTDGNLRLSTRSQNAANKPSSVANASGFKGVRRDRRTKNWIAEITYQKKRIYIGSFEEPADAALAYDQKAIELFREFANTNF